MKIKLYTHMLAGGEPEDFEVTSLAAWLVARYEKNPKVTFEVYVGQPSEDTRLAKTPEALMACNAAEVTVLETPGDPATLAAIGSYVIKVAIAYAIGAVISMLLPKPKQPANVNRSQQSPNNALGARENQVRLLERVEDIYGRVEKAIPSLMMVTYNKYIDNRKYEWGYYCVSRGYVQVSLVRDADTLISELPDASVRVYHPYTSPNSGHSAVYSVGPAITDPVQSVTRSVEVDGLVLKPLNLLQLAVPADYQFTKGVSGAGDKIAQWSYRPNLMSIVTPGDTMVISMTPEVFYSDSPATAITATVAGSVRTLTDSGSTGVFASYSVGNTFVITDWVPNNGTYTVTTKTNSNVITVSAGITAGSGNPILRRVTATVDYSGSYTVATVGDAFVTFTTTTWTQDISKKTCNITLSGVSEWTSWITLPNLARTKIWFNVAANNGMYRDNGSKFVTDVTYTAQIEQLTSGLVPTGTVQTITGFLSGAITDVVAQTLEHTTSWTGPARVRLRRDTQNDYDFNGNIVDEIAWEDLYSVNPVSKTEFGNKTTVHTVTPATPKVTAIKARQLNMTAERMLPTYNGTVFSAVLNSDGLLTSGTLYPTRKVVNIIAALASDPKIGRRILADDVDMAQLWSTQQTLDTWNTLCGEFSYTFDSDQVSFEESVTMVANSAFCIAYRQNGKIRLSIDRQQSSSTALFTHRNKRPKSERVTRTFYTDSGFDAVEFIYTDSVTCKPETIRLPTDGSGTKYKKYEIPGIRNFEQAWFRANREYYKLLGQRVTIETDTTTDARTLLPNARIAIVDNTRFKSYDGEVVGQSGLTLTLSRSVTFTPSQPHSIILMRRDGSLQSISCTAGSSANQVVLATAPSEAIVTLLGNDGIRTIFSFAADNARLAQAYLVQEVGVSDGKYMQVKGVNYSDTYYQADYATIPSKDATLNS